MMRCICGGKKGSCAQETIYVLPKIDLKITRSHEISMISSYSMSFVWSIHERVIVAFECYHGVLPVLNSEHNAARVMQQLAN